MSLEVQYLRLRLCEGLENKNHKLFLNNLFSSIALLKHLQQIYIFVLGTIRKNRLSGASVKLVTEKDL